MKTKKIVIALLLITAAVVAYYAYTNRTIEQPQIDSKLVSLDIGFSRLRISLPVFVAKEKGIFEKNGIDANLIMYETAQPLMQALISEKVDAAGYTALPITYNGMLRSGKELYFISAMMEDEKHRISYLLRNKKENTINSISDLKGKRIGILPTIAYQAWISNILKKNGLNPETDVVIQQIAPTQQGQALANGAIDALFTNDPAATSMIQKGIAELVTNEVEVPKYIMNPFPFGSFNVNKKWADTNKDTYLKLIKSLNEAIEFVNTSPAEAKLTMIPYLPEAFKNDVKFYPNAYYRNTDESDEILFQNIADLYKEIGIIKNSVSVKGLVE